MEMWKVGIMQLDPLTSFLRILGFFFLVYDGSSNKRAHFLVASETYLPRLCKFT